MIFVVMGVLASFVIICTLGLITYAINTAEKDEENMSERDSKY